jgi:hypothetical protein
MAVTQSTSRKDLRQAIGRLTGKMERRTASSNGSTTTIVDSSLPGGDNEHNGKRAVLHDGNNAGAIKRVTDYVASTTTLTIAPTAAAAVNANHTFELWERNTDPNDINDLINDAIKDITGLFFDPVEDAALHADGRQTRFDIPSGLSMVHRVMYRTSMRSKVIHTCGRTWDEKTDADFTVAVDTKDYKRSKGSLKITVAAGASAADSISDSIDSLDLSGMTHVEFWIKCSVAVTSGNLKLLLDDTASVASPVETLSIPTLVADTWTRVRIALANPESDTAIISVGLDYAGDIGACTIWLDDIVAMNNDSEVWAPLASHLWSIDKEAGDLILASGGRMTAGYARLKLLGGDKPALLTADTGTTEVPEDFIVNWAVGRMLLSEGGGPTTDQDAHHSRSQPWLVLAQRAKDSIHLPPGARMVS